MALDRRSMERLEALGRTLPKKLPPPEPSPSGGGRNSPSPSTGSGSPGVSARPPEPLGKPLKSPRHPVEEVQEPEDLFRALVKASPDGTVPPHLLDRLRELETSRLSSAESPTPSSPAHASGRASTRVAAAPRSGKGAQRSSSDRSRQGKAQGPEDQTLYAAFAQLLLEDEAGA